MTFSSSRCTPSDESNYPGDSILQKWHPIHYLIIALALLVVGLIG
ncbi:MAG: hypothetical protein ACEQSB_01640 [Undibacterium sp.]